jgi:hypothetical protein
VSSVLLQDISSLSHLALRHPHAFPLKGTPLTKVWSPALQEVYSLRFIHSLGCAGTSEAKSFPQTAAKILFLVAQQKHQRDVERSCQGQLFSPQ